MSQEGLITRIQSWLTFEMNTCNYHMTRIREGNTMIFAEKAFHKNHNTEYLLVKKKKTSYINQNRIIFLSLIQGSTKGKANIKLNRERLE